MTLLPEGLVVPPLPYAVVLGVLTVAVALALYRLEPAVEETIVLGAVPWMAAGASAHVFFQLERVVDVYPDAIESLAAAPAIYVTTFVGFGAVWAGLAAVERDADTGRGLAAAGTVALLALLAFAGVRGAYDGVKPVWPLIGLVVTIPLTAVVYAAVAAKWPEEASKAGALGMLTVFAHALDGVTTTVGIDVLNQAERSPLPDRIMEFAGTLPTEPFLGTGWLFVLVKLAVAAAIVVAFAEYMDDAPERGTLLFGAVVALGLGPAVNNLVLFALRDVAPL
jgi:uncharacterized membrane protein